MADGGDNVMCYPTVRRLPKGWSLCHSWQCSYRSLPEACRQFQRPCPTYRPPVRFVFAVVAANMAVKGDPRAYEGSLLLLTAQTSETNSSFGQIQLWNEAVRSA